MDLASQLLVCLSVTALCAGLARLVPLPLPLVQTVAGVLLAWPLGMVVPLDPHAFLLLLIPPLLFIEGWRIPKREFRRHRSTILLMAFGLVVMTALGVGLFLAWLIPAIPLPVAFAVAAALSPTDAVAVSGMTGRGRLPSWLMTILQGEALFNDASGLVSLRIAVAAMLTGAFSLASATGSFAWVSLAGIAIGVALTWLFGKMLRLVLDRGDDTAAGPRILLIIAFPYIAYMVAEHFGVSGILAAASAGMMATRFELVEPRHRTARLQGAVVLNMVELALNGLVFVLLGLQLPHILDDAPAIAREAGLSLAWLAVDVGLVALALLAVRFAWVWVSFRATMYRARARGQRRATPPLRLVLVTALAGVRGAMTLAAALTLPLTLTDGERFPARDVAIFFATTIIVLWLLAASLLLPRLLRGLDLPVVDQAAVESELRAQLARAAIVAVEEHLDTSARDGRGMSGETTDLVLDHYRTRAGGTLEPHTRALADERELRLVGLTAERARLIDLAQRERLDDATFRAIMRELDLAEEGLMARGLATGPGAASDAPSPPADTLPPTA